MILPSVDTCVAEWDKAGVILMHTPGYELFNGVIHPLAGLFEDYFDVDKAGGEHRGFIHMLEKNGISVHTVGEILNEVEIESLRVIADSVLKYDVSAIEDADEEATEAYRQEVLSKMSRSDLIRCILLKPKVRLYRTDNNTGFDGTYIQDPLTNLYFTRDQSICTQSGYIIGHMNSEQRAPETDIIELCYRHLGLSPIFRVSGEGMLEGGDYFPAGKVSIIGCGMRTNYAGIRQIMENDAFGHDTVVVVKDHKFWQKQMHLDAYFNIIDCDLCTMVRGRLDALPGTPDFLTCDIWTRKRGDKEYSLAESDLSFVEYLRDSGFQIIPVDYPDDMHYGNNYVTVSPRHIMAVAGQSEVLKKRFREAGVNVEWVTLENLIRGYGGAHCMTQVLRRFQGSK